jgi:dihydroflavonol-4-reductase
MQDCQVLFHVAACYSLWQRDRSLLHHSNILGTRNILTCARKAKIERTVYTSSVAAIGVGADGQVVDETYQSPVAKLTGYYKKSKYYAEQEAIAATDLGQDIVIVNPTTPIGAWDIKPTPTGEMIVRFLERRMPFYVDTGLNLIDVEDVSWGHLLALNKGCTGERYILGNQNLTLKQILDLLAQITGLPAPNKTIPYWIPYTVAWVEEKILAPLGKKPSISLDGVKMSRQKMFYNSHKAITHLGLPQSSIKTALNKAVNWFQV